MAFQDIKQIQNETIHERTCIMLYQFNSQEVKQIVNVAKMAGIKEYIDLQSKHGGCTLREILDDEVSEKEEATIKEKAIILNHVVANKMNLFMELLKKCRLKRPIIAVVTEQSIDWTLAHLLVNLASERQAINEGQFNKAHQ